MNAFRKPPKPVADTSISDPMHVRAPCVFCGVRLSIQDKRTHNCWSKTEESSKK